MPDVVVAPAKLTLSLRVTGVRADGYHLIDAEMVSLDLADELTFADGDGLDGARRRRRTCRPATTTWCARALRAVGPRAPTSRLDKRIPAGAGLGGGSADAAAVLRWAGVDDLDVAGVARRRRAVLPRRRPGPGAPASARWSSRCRSRPRPSRC